MSGRCARGGDFVPGTHIEVLSPEIPRGQFRHALFDLDGTLSLIREGWQQVMIPMMVELLAGTPRAESAEHIESVVTDFVTQLTGKQTIYQMMRLCEEIQKRGGTAAAPLTYKHTYVGRLMERIRSRREGLARGSIQPEDMLVAGSREILDALKNRGIVLYCASGTDQPYVAEETRLLGIASCFDGGLYGALDDYKKFSKRMLIENIIADHGLHSGEFITFGDGYVEIEETKSAGGMAVGVASDEVRRGGLDGWKRERLVRAGADIIVPDFREYKPLLGYLLGRQTADGRPPREGER